MVRARQMAPAEIALAQSVYASTLPFDRIFITDLDLGGAVTLASMEDNAPRFDYAINWVEGFGGIVDFAARRSTLIHELCHAWQGENGVWPTFYMAQSMWAQLSSGVRDIWRKREWKGWGSHRSTAYPFPADAIGRNWATFNVEQQASLIESWYMPETERVVAIGKGRLRIHDFGPGVHGGGRSEHDARFPYVRDVIRASNRNAVYKPLALPTGGDAVIKSVQEHLVALGYLEARHADGLVGRGNSATLDAVAEFQRRNGLKVDRDLGGANSETRRKLSGPVAGLVRAR
ncbi:peptidoglycan-binding domain-containing protein [Sphingomonas solaris]|uniref:peptidoglycan-binding domain-containing protein n=1 Tax=Alterirhizorhabdus solaris TaxID=2529389 RepID=UPI0013968C53|nr:peptidoglycan-binding domain-containing protein [Sphingomonas solaris]